MDKSALKERAYRIMTMEQNIKSILECFFTGFKEEIIEHATKRIMEQISSGSDRLVDSDHLVDANEILDQIEEMQESLKSDDDFLWDIHRDRFKGLAYANRIILDELGKRYGYEPGCYMREMRNK